MVSPLIIEFYFQQQNALKSWWLSVLPTRIHFFNIYVLLSHEGLESFNYWTKVLLFYYSKRHLTVDSRSKLLIHTHTKAHITYIHARILYCYIVRTCAVIRLPSVFSNVKRAVFPYTFTCVCTYKNCVSWLMSRYRESNIQKCFSSPWFFFIITLSFSFSINKTYFPQ